jgi:protein TonB
VAVGQGSLVALEEVDTPPRVARVVKPVYPPLALQARVGATVVLRVLVNERGLPDEIEVLREGRAGLTEAAVRAVKGWTFEPARKDGVPVKTWISVPIPFQP